MHSRTITEYFAAVAEELSFTAAAARLNVAQPWLSSRIRQLEQQLGYALFVRTTRRVELTEQGKALLPRAQEIARAMHAFDETARALGKKAEPLRIGVPLYAGRIPMVRQVLDGLGKGRSPITYDVDIAWTRQLIAQLEAGELDAVIVLAPQHSDAFSLLVLEETLLEIEMDADDPLAKAPFSITALAGRSVEVFSRKPNPWLFDALYGALENGGAKLVQSGNMWSLKTKPQTDAGVLVAGTRALWGGPSAKGRIRRVPEASPSAAICLLKRRDADGAALNRLWEIARSAAGTASSGSGS
jgi:DNA-binding transcriptional LysR family regulator